MTNLSSDRPAEIPWGRHLQKRVRRVVVRSVVHAGAAVVRIHPLFWTRRHRVTVERDVDYRTAASPEHRLDIFRPQGPQGHLPVVVYIHGGGFSLLSKDTHFGMGMTFAKRGYLVFNINYRLAPVNRYPAAMEDVCAALEWVVANAANYGGDLARLVFAGESAGANLALSLALASTYRRPEPWARRVFDLGVVPKAIVPACGILQVSDVSRLWEGKTNRPPWMRAALHEMSAAYLGPDASEREEWGFADPLRIIESSEPDRPLPSCYAFVGTRDVLLDDTRRLVEALRGRGVDASADYLPGEIHAFHAFLWRPAAKRVWRRTFEFLERVL